MTHARGAGLLLAAIVLGACSGAATATAPANAPDPMVAPGVGQPVPIEAGPAVEVASLVAAAAENDGRSVRAAGFLLIDPTSARLCAGSLDSLPPGCSGPSVRLTGTVPRATLERLARTKDAQVPPHTWGSVVVTGVFRASGVGGGPTIELGEMIPKD